MPPSSRRREGRRPGGGGSRWQDEERIEIVVAGSIGLSSWWRVLFGGRCFAILHRLAKFTSIRFVPVFKQAACVFVSCHPDQC
ncbi:hypothetical protein BCR44DRAFT_37070 [Catenaria anguillulae PL171]|uniref:Uncharacterized protein n=1 Tax=Catenaria anguillulae PL171 TaxID=765915 RepID=A0A1Y2HTR7_9FUNG|nr:hypothetical protein BCR44DRAFT_37070 [Catenaria anguillulae PL171]